MRELPYFIVAAALALGTSLPATQADDTTITIAGTTAGVTPFISQVHLIASDSSVVKSIQFTISPKPDSITRPLSGTFTRSYLLEAGYLMEASQDIYLPVYGLYHSYANSITLTYTFNDGSSKAESTTITTATFDDTCGYETPVILQSRTQDTSLSYDYMLVKERCNSFSPTIIDTDSAIRWAGPGGIFNYSSAFFDNAAYQAAGTILYRLDLDGTVTLLHDYTDIGVTEFHHNIDPGKTGLLLEVDTIDDIESVILEVDIAGDLLKTWNLAEIISAAMIAGGDDPSQFVYSAPTDWFHNNSTTYDRASDSLIVSSRENFVIALDYETGAIKWILGDPSKKWHEFPSLVQYSLALGPDTLPPIGQHALSITYDNSLLLFDNGYNSLFQMPPGDVRPYSSPRKYQLDLVSGLATEVWNYEMDQSTTSPICSSIYEDAPNNYLVDYAFVGGFALETRYAELLGLNSAGEKVFHYQYPTLNCNEAFNSIPLHLEKTIFPAVGPKALNLSTRGTISTGDNVLIAGFIIQGADDKKVALRVLGPSLGDSGLAVLGDPVLTVYDASGSVIANNDDWESDPAATEIIAAGLAPQDSAEAALVQTLPPGSYTVVAAGKDQAPGIGLIEIYDLSPADDSLMANLSTRGLVDSGDQVLIAGFIVGDVGNASVILRAVGPSLAPVVNDVLSDPTLTVYDENGVALASNDNWQEGPNSAEIEQNGLAPQDVAEAALLLHPPTGLYTAVVNGAEGSTGTGLVELYDLD